MAPDGKRIYRRITDAELRLTRKAKSAPHFVRLFRKAFPDSDRTETSIKALYYNRAKLSVKSSGDCRKGKAGRPRKMASELELLAEIRNEVRLLRKAVAALSPVQK